jgi:hypothetical protein
MYSLKPWTKRRRAMGAVAGYSKLACLTCENTIHVFVNNCAESSVTYAVSVDILEGEEEDDG